MSVISLQEREFLDFRLSYSPLWSVRKIYWPRPRPSSTVRSYILNPIISKFMIVSPDMGCSHHSRRVVVAKRVLVITINTAFQAVTA